MRKEDILEEKKLLNQEFSTIEELFNYF